MSSTCCIAPTSCIDLDSVDGGIRAVPLLSSNADNALVCGPDGLSGPVLQVPSFKVTRSVDNARSPANVNPTVVGFDVTTWNLGGWTLAVVGPGSQMVAPEDGVYVVGANVSVTAANVGTGRYGISIEAQRAAARLSGGVFVEVAAAHYGDAANGAATVDVTMCCSGPLWMNRGDAFQVGIFCSATANITIRAGSQAWAVKLP